MSLWQVPAVLIVHLKRFSYANVRRSKIDHFIEFPLRLVWSSGGRGEGVKGREYGRGEGGGEREGCEGGVLVMHVCVFACLCCAPLQ